MRIPEPQRFDAARDEIFFPFEVMLSLVGKTVLAAIQFDYEPGFNTGEVGEISVDWDLPAELVATDLPIANHPPQPPFSVGLIAPKLTRAKGAGLEVQGANIAEVRPAARNTSPEGGGRGPRPSRGRVRDYGDSESVG